MKFINFQLGNCKQLRSKLRYTTNKKKKKKAKNTSPTCDSHQTHKTPLVYGYGGAQQNEYERDFASEMTFSGHA